MAEAETWKAKKTSETPPLHFDVSTGLAKRVLGRELITNRRSCHLRDGEKLL